MSSDDENVDVESPDEFSSSGEEEVQRPRKRRKAGNGKDVSSFFMDEAEVDDYEEEDEEAEAGFSDLEDDAPIEQTRQERFAARRPLQNLEQEAEELEARAKQYEERFEANKRRPIHHTQAPKTFVAQRQFLPTVHDPKLWMIRCKPGMERKAVVSLLQKCRDKELLNEPLQIKSVLCLDHLKGYIYIEALKAAHVKTAIEGLRVLMAFGIKLVPVKEMVDVLKVPKNNIVLNAGNWVRIKKGMYKGDLAQILSVGEDQGSALVKFVPRFDINTVAKKPGMKRKRLTRIPQRFFDRDEVEQLGGDVSDTNYFGVDCLAYKSNRYLSGFQIKNMALKSLDIMGVTPSPNELQKFQEKNEEEDLALATSSANYLHRVKRKQLFAKGDVVKVIEGDLKNLMGTVESVRGDDVVILPMNDTYKALVHFPASQLRKHFKNGSHVKVVSGRYEGQTGVIVKLEGDVAVVYSDLTNRELQLLVHDIQECSDVTSGRIQLGNYELHDLVNLGPQMVGVIVKIEQKTLHVLDNSGNVRALRLAEMGNKRRSGQSYDRHQNPISVGDVVRVVEGKFKNKQGTIKHVYRHHVFLFSRDMSENSGIYVVRSNQVSLLGSGAISRAAARKEYQSDPNQQHHGKPPIEGMVFWDGKRDGPNRRNDAMLNQSVRILAGPYKNYIGIAVDCNDNMYRVELHSKNKLINVDRSRVQLANTRSSGPRDDYGGRTLGGYTPLRGDQTPMHGDRTPMHGDQTPLHGDRTPLHGDRTPLHGDRTPNRGDRTPVHDWARPNTPMEDWRDPYSPAPTPNQGGFNQYSPYSPGANMYGRVGTPQDPQSYPNTPGGFNMDTPGYGQQAESPFPGSTPMSYPTTPSTPGSHPQTPATPGATLAQEEPKPSSMLVTDIVVRIHEAFAGGQYQNSTGVIREIGDTCVVHVEPSGQAVSIPADYLEIVPPSKRDFIKIIGGDLHNATGSLIGIDGTDGIVKLDTDKTDIQIIKMQKLAKYQLAK